MCVCDLVCICLFLYICQVPAEPCVTSLYLYGRRFVISHVHRMCVRVCVCVLAYMSACACVHQRAVMDRSSSLFT